MQNDFFVQLAMSRNGSSDDTTDQDDAQRQDLHWAVGLATRGQHLG